jgi:hypothetical protein
VNNRCRGIEDDVESSLLDPPAEIDVLAIEEEALVPTSDAFEYRALD